MRNVTDAMMVCLSFYVTGYSMLIVQSKQTSY